MHWHMNFADPHVFGYYGGALLAQDELQVVEHPVLASVKEALCAATTTTTTTTPNEAGAAAEAAAAGLLPLTVDPYSGAATPILVQGAPRRVALDTSRLYGDLFAQADSTLIDESVRVLDDDPPTVSNILALSALQPFVGLYTITQIQQLFETAYTGFRAIVRQSSPATAVTLHTAHWGCGAFGGNKGLVAAIQLLAAGTAGLDRVEYWCGFGSTDRQAVEHGHAVAQLLSGQAVSEVCELLDSAGYGWGCANENHVPYEPPRNCLLLRAGLSSSSSSLPDEAGNSNKSK